MKAIRNSIENGLINNIYRKELSIYDNRLGTAKTDHKCKICGYERGTSQLRKLKSPVTDVEFLICQACINKERRGKIRNLAREHGLTISEASFLATLFKRSHEHSLESNGRIEFSISFDEIASLWLTQGGSCALSGISLVLSSTKDQMYSASIDRIDSGGSYIVTNIHFVSLLINMMKQSFPVDTFVTMCCRVAKYSGQWQNTSCGAG